MSAITTLLPQDETSREIFESDSTDKLEKEFHEIDWTVFGDKDRFLNELCLSGRLRLIDLF